MSFWGGVWGRVQVGGGGGLFCVENKGKGEGGGRVGGGEGTGNEPASQYASFVETTL